MSKKHTFRRSAAGILAVLTVTGNLIAPAQFRLPVAPASIEVDAASLMGNKNSGYSWDNTTKTLTIKKGISNISSAIGHPVDDPLDFDVNFGGLGIFNARIDVEPSTVKHIVIEAGATLPKTWESMLTLCTNLESLKINATVDASNVYNFGSAFKNLDKLTEVDFSGIVNTGSIDYIENMFTGCTNLKKIDLSMITGENVGKREWTNHKAIDHIRRAVAYCDQLEELNLTGDFLYRALTNINSVDHTRLTIDDLLEVLLQDNNSPYRNKIKADLKVAYDEYVTLMNDPFSWHASSWKWTQQTDGSYTCKVTMYRRNAENHYKTDRQTVDAEVTYVDYPQSTCTTQGTRTFSASWSDPDSNLVLHCTEKKTLSLPKNQHDHQVVGFTWNADHTAATVTLRCLNNGCGDTKTANADSIRKTVVAPTCTTAGYTTYVAVYGDVESEPEVVVGDPALGHAFANPVWNWNGFAAELTLSCTNADCTETVKPEVTVTSAVTTEPTYTTEGVRTYYATATYEGKTYNDEKTEVISALERTDISDEETGITVTGLENRTYNGEAASASVSVGDAVLTAGTDYEIAFTQNDAEAEPRNAGTYAYTITGIGAYKGEVTGTLTISPAVAELSWTNTDLTYTGEAQAPSAAVSNLIGEDACDVTVEGAQVNAGSYTATAAALSNANYALPENAEQDFTIAAISMGDVIAKSYNGIYDAAAHSITVTVPEGASVVYALDAEGEFTAENPAFINAGTYDVYFKVTKENCIEVEGTAQVVIDKADVADFTVTIEGWTEGEEPNTPAASAEGASFVYAAQDSEDFSENVPTAAGTYTVKAILAETENYYAAEATADFEIAEAAPVIHGELVEGNTVTFAENIMLNVFARIDEGYTEGAFVRFTYMHYGEEKIIEVPLSEANLTPNGYRFGCPLTASELCIPVKSELFLADSEEAVSERGGSAKDYCARMLARETTKETTKAALLALLNYGGCVQINQGLNLDAIASEGYEADLSGVEIESANEFVKPETAVGGVSYFGASLLLKDQVTVRYAFKADSLEGVTFKINGEVVEATQNGSLYTIDAAPVRARNLDNVNTVTVETAEGTMSFTHTALNYAAGKATDDPANKLSNTMKAMFMFYEAVLNMQ